MDGEWEPERRRRRLSRVGTRVPAQTARLAGTSVAERRVGPSLLPIEAPTVAAAAPDAGSPNAGPPDARASDAGVGAHGTDSGRGARARERARRSAADDSRAARGAAAAYRSAAVLRAVRAAGDRCSRCSCARLQSGRPVQSVDHACSPCGAAPDSESGPRDHFRIQGQPVVNLGVSDCSPCADCIP